MPCSPGWPQTVAVLVIFLAAMIKYLDEQCKRRRCILAQRLMVHDGEGMMAGT